MKMRTLRVSASSVGEHPARLKSTERRSPSDERVENGRRGGKAAEGSGDRGAEVQWGQRQRVELAVEVEDNPDRVG